MRSSSLFIAFFLLIVTAILAYYGMAAFAPLPGEGPAQQQQDITATPLDKPQIVFGNPTIGPKGALVTIVEYGDYLCTGCQLMEEPVQKALQQYAGEVRFVWKDLPNTQLHPQAYKAAEAARCADRQGAFWKYHDLLFANQNSLNDDAYSIFAQQLGLNSDEFDTCMQTEATKYVVQQDIEEALRLNIDATPYLFIGDSKVSGSLSETQFLTYVGLEVSRAEQKIGLPPKTDASASSPSDQPADGAAQ